MLLEMGRVYERALETLQILQSETKDPYVLLYVQLSLNLFEELKSLNEALYFQTKELLG